MKPIKPFIHACFALTLAACGGGDLSIGLPGETPPQTLKLDFPPGRTVEHPLPFRISGGVPPYISSIDGCPDWVTLFPDQGVLAGTAPASDHGSSFFCTYVVTDSATFTDPQTRSFGLHLAVDSLTTLVLPSSPDQELSIGTYRSVTLPAASGGLPPYTYSLTCAGGMLPSGMGFAPATRVFAGTPNARFRDSCTYSVTDSSQPAETVSQAIEITSAAEQPLALPEDVVLGGAVNRVSFTMQRREREMFAPASGGVRPYTYELVGCTLPDGLSFSPDTLVLSGTPLETYRGPDCTYRVTDSNSPPTSVSRSFELIVEPLDRGTWRFRTRTVEPGGPCTLPDPGTRTEVATLPHAQGGEAGQDVYRLIDFPNNHFLAFDAGRRQLTYIHPSAVPILGTPNTYRYLVGAQNGNGEVNAANADDALCLDVQFNPGDGICPDPDGDGPLDSSAYLHIQLRVRDDAFWDENAGTAGEYRCPDTTAREPRSGAQSVSNPVHTALAPVHARRAIDVAHAAVRDRVRGWSPGAPRDIAISPSVDFASLSGLNGGFDYAGSSRSLSGAVELGADSWQAGLVAAFTRTDLRYRAAAGLAARGYHAGEHNTEIFSLHPFAAWHAPSGGHLWASLGAGLGDLRHRDDLGFPSWSSSDVRLRAYAVGGAVPVTRVLSGELRAEVGVESFIFEIEGGGQISSSLPMLQGRDYRAGLAWSAPIAGAPVLSVAYKQLTGDGPEGGSVETRGSASIAGVFDPRLTVIGNAEGSFGLGDHEHDSWGLSSGIRFAPGELHHGLGLEIDTRLMSLDGGESADVGIRGEAGYGLWGGPFLGTIRPYAGLIRFSSDGSLRRVLGVDLRDTPDSWVKVEVYDRPRDRLRALRFSLRHRF